jgi:hypothetical protein
MNQCCHPLPLGLGGKKIGKPFDLGQIEPTILEGAPRKCARLSRLKIGQFRKHTLHRRHHGPSAVEM